MASRTIPHIPQSPMAHASEDEEGVHDEDLCPVCHQLLYRPVTTKCNHTLCESCMAHWADVSVTSSGMTIVSLDEEPSTFNANDIEARCPMCRTLTTASLNPDMIARFEAQYPKLYREREAEEESSSTDGPVVTIETLTLYIGNKHQIIESETANMHEWTFFVKPSRTDIIKEVRILLHPTFRPNRLVHDRPPYEIRRLGWGYFTIAAHVVLERGYAWLSGEARSASEHRSTNPKAMLPLEWTLDFDGFGGRGSMGRCRLKVKKEV